MRLESLLFASACALVLGVSAPAAGSAAETVAVTVTDFSAQTGRQARRPRPRPRITVRPLPRDLSDYRRLCEPVFEERWIPQWGGSVLYASQRCRWVRL